MITHKHIDRIVLSITALAVLLCVLAMGFSSQLAAAGDTGVTMQYESKLFDTSEPLEINIIMDSSDWEELLENATQETYYECDVEINGKTFYSVGIRPKGNTSLTSIASDPDTDRYSLKLEFDHYIEDQTCYGLDKLILNNNYADATNMKEALIYDMFQYLGADASLYNYASISVNGEYWGVYLALEGVEDSFMLRNYGVENGNLYKPDSMEMGGEAGGDGGGGGFSMGGGGSDLTYTDDELDSYSTIWDGSITSTSDSDHERVVTALKNISEGTDLEDYMDIDNLLRYAAVHMFSVNEDSLSGAMSHNYYLYEYNGKLNLIPWDYNLALGGMNGTDATDMVNDPIDDIFSGTTFFDTLMENEEYLGTYHEYLSQLVEEYINGGAFDEFYERTRSQIDSLAEEDPTAFYTYDEYLTAADTFYQAVKLRGESIQGQLDGTIPSTSSGQRSDSSSLIDASAIELSAMGTMNAGGGGAEMGGFGGNNFPGNFSTDDLPEGFDLSDIDLSNLPDNMGSMPEGFDAFSIPDNAGSMPDNNGTVPEGSDASSLPDNAGSMPDNNGTMPEGSDASSLPDSAGSMPEGADSSALPDNSASDSSQEDETNTEESSSEETEDASETGADTPAGNTKTASANTTVTAVATAADSDNTSESTEQANLPEGFDASNLPGNAGSMPEGFDASNLPDNAGNMPEGFTPSAGGSANVQETGAGSGNAAGTSSAEAESEDETAENKSAEDETANSSDEENETAQSEASEGETGGGMPAGGDNAGGQQGQGGGFGNFDPSDLSGFSGFSDSSTADQSETITENLIVWGICFAVLIAALLFALLFRRKPRRR